NPDVDAARKARMSLQRRPDDVDGRVRDRIDGDDGVRVAHGDGAKLDGAPGRLDPIAVALLGHQARQRFRPEVRNAEIDADAVGRLDVRGDRTGGAHELQVVAETRCEITSEAADAVTAL